MAPKHHRVSRDERGQVGRWSPMDVLRAVIRETLVLQEAQRDVEQLVKVNRAFLRREMPRKPNEDVREYEQRLTNFAEAGVNPLGKSGRVPFSSTTMEVILDLYDADAPNGDRKRYFMWLANQIESGEVEELIDDAEDPNAADFMYRNSYIVDWLSATGSDEYLQMSWREAGRSAATWHDEQAQKTDDTISIKGDEVIHTFPDGVDVVRVKPENLKDEGTAMGHCVAGYEPHVRGGKTQIFSIRDPQGKPHVTIEVRPQKHDIDDEIVTINHVEQVRGKQNGPPVEKWARYAREWLRKTDFEFLSKTDYAAIADEHDVQRLLDENEPIVGDRLNRIAQMTHNPDVLGIIASFPEGLTSKQIERVSTLDHTMMRNPGDRAAMALDRLRRMAVGNPACPKEIVIRVASEPSFPLSREQAVISLFHDDPMAFSMWLDDMMKDPQKNGADFLRDVHRKFKL